MKHFLLRLLITAVAVLLAARLLPGIEITGGWALVFTVVILSVFNAFLRPLMIFLTLPITLLSFGLFIFVINGIILYLTSMLVSGFEIHSLLSAVVASILISIVSSVINWLAKG